MKIICNRASLLTACQCLASAIPTRTTLPILQSAKLDAKDGNLVMSATDTELGIRYVVEGVQVFQDGTTMIPFAQLMAILKECDEEQIDIEASEIQVNISTVSSSYDIPTESASNFPDIPEFNSQNSKRVSSGILDSLIKRTVFAVGMDSTRFALTGVLIEVSDKNLSFVATDTRRLALAVKGLDGEPVSLKAIVPAKALSLLQKNIAVAEGLADGEFLVDISINENEIQFKTDKTTIYSRLLQGRYPPYMNIMPKKFATSIPISSESFISVIKKTRIMTDSEICRVSLIFNSGVLQAKAQGATTGKSKASIPVNYDGPEISVDLDPDFMIEGLRVMEGEITFQINDPGKPIVLRSTDYIYLVMPLV